MTYGSALVTIQFRNEHKDIYEVIVRGTSFWHRFNGVSSPGSVAFGPWTWLINRMRHGAFRITLYYAHFCRRHNTHSVSECVVSIPGWRRRPSIESLKQQSANYVCENAFDDGRVCVHRDAIALYIYLMLSSARRPVLIVHKKRLKRLLTLT